MAKPTFKEMFEELSAHQDNITEASSAAALDKGRDLKDLLEKGLDKLEKADMRVKKEAAKVFQQAINLLKGLKESAEGGTLDEARTAGEDVARALLKKYQYKDAFEIKDEVVAKWLLKKKLVSANKGRGTYSITDKGKNFLESVELDEKLTQESYELNEKKFSINGMQELQLKKLFNGFTGFKTLDLKSWQVDVEWAKPVQTGKALKLIKIHKKPFKGLGGFEDFEDSNEVFFTLTLDGLAIAKQFMDRGKIPAKEVKFK